MKYFSLSSFILEYQTSVLSPVASVPVGNKLCPFKAFNNLINQATVNLLSYKSLFVHPRRSKIVAASLSSLQRLLCFFLVQ